MVYALQHVACEPPGLIAQILKAEGLKLDFIRPFRGDRVPEVIGDHAGLVLMGGPMGVYDQGRYPFLKKEIRLLQSAVSQRRPVLGICLGSQLLATALGAPVMPAKQKEIGWHQVTLGRNAAQDRLWRDLPESFCAFHWHGDVFELPFGAKPLAWSNLTDCQAFALGEFAYGFLFHLEVTEPMVARMARTFKKELADAGLDGRSVLNGAREHLRHLHTIARIVFKRWAALAIGMANLPAGSATAPAQRVQPLARTRARLKRSVSKRAHCQEIEI
jgi:GMP synthase (glutamine-hydrolysing)